MKAYTIENPMFAINNMSAAPSPSWSERLMAEAHAAVREYEAAYNDQKTTAPDHALASLYGRYLIDVNDCC